ncbi:MAG: thioesterase [Actinomycetota bacterium]|nr:thioesterase [Actinomycetota bacterium]
MADTPADLVERPAAGRVFEGLRKVRIGDVDPRGRMRLDAAVRFLQDLSADDTADAALPDAEAWVVRRTTIEVHRFPRYLEGLALATWCSGTGSHWAERRVTIVGDRGGHIEASSIWVHVDLASGRPSRIPAGFDEIYGEAAGGRRVKARLVHHDPGPDAQRQPWVIRHTDLDVLDHVNNAAYWEAVEEARAADGTLHAPLRVEVEHHNALEHGDAAELVTTNEGDALHVWVTGPRGVGASAVLRPR